MEVSDKIAFLVAIISEFTIFKDGKSRYFGNDSSVFTVHPAGKEMVRRIR